MFILPGIFKSDEFLNNWLLKVKKLLKLMREKPDYDKFFKMALLKLSKTKSTKIAIVVKFESHFDLNFSL